jgi:hypothetical protein
MAIPSRQIGWGTESNLLWQILKQLNKLTSVLFGLKEAATPNYKVYTALLTQSGGDGPTLVIDLPLVIGVTYEILDDDSGTVDFTNVGAPNNTVGTFFVATGTTPTSWGDNLLGELEFNSGAPVAIVLENTIGDIWFTYSSAGGYIVTLANVGFQQNDTALFLSNSSSNQNGIVYLYVQGSNDISIETTNLSGIYGDGYLSRNTLEIRVYN